MKINIRNLVLQHTFNLNKIVYEDIKNIKNQIKHHYKIVFLLFLF
jgi:hypothetical protein